MAISSDESGASRRTMRELVTLSALPAVWAGCHPRQVAEGLAEVLLATLGLDLVYLRLAGPTNGQEIEVVRTAGGPPPTDQARVVGRALAPWLDGAGIDPAPTLPNPVGPGTLRVAVVPIGGGQQDGVLVAGSRRAAFPSEEDRLILTVGANQAAAVLQRLHAVEALRESEQRWRSLTEALPQLVWSATPEGACDYFSTQWTASRRGTSGWSPWRGATRTTWNTGSAAATGSTAGSRPAGCRSGTTTGRSSNGSGPAPTSPTSGRPRRRCVRASGGSGCSRTTPPTPSYCTELLTAACWTSAAWRARACGTPGRS